MVAHDSVLQIASLRSSLSETQLAALTGKSKLLQQKIDSQSGQLKAGGVPAWKGTVGNTDCGGRGDLFIVETVIFFMRKHFAALNT